jgi:hypothetical protein
MSNVVIGSAWRSSEHNVPRYLDQIVALRDLVRDDYTIKILAVEGDSLDGTANALVRGAAARNLDLTLVEFDQRTPHFGSVEDPKRMNALSEVFNRVLDAVDEDTDIFVYVESDLLWKPQPLANLIRLVDDQEEGMDVIAPLIFAGPHFYDIWGFRKGGERFGPFPPYHPGLNRNGLTEVDSVGSCLAMRAEVAWETRIKNGNAIVGWCEEARSLGYKIGVHANLEVHHP